MNIVKTSIDDLMILEPRVFGDERGFFLESYNKRIFDRAIGCSTNFVQDNHSCSQQGVLRGLHLQKSPHGQGKLVRCIKGEVFDVAVDLRMNSKTFGKWVGVYLNEDNKKQFWIPNGFAHGFYVVSDSAEFVYKTTDYYAPSHELSLAWDDSDINIKWPILDGKVLLSEKDRLGIRLSEIRKYL
ncbi:dTDP-4-dehydrorhamnose 3,5-epimerase [Citrobacter portucalensis]|uniref:dTDP-4-dehydrorhamnose 3,5-epimerase n=1 Tax=Citrobacter portucalensis TaxID=1639133 RepID=UPI001C63D807|nr:dTDP-4-dehydrorhamnose 3,5-epimerase [Citrobacter portucalensis]MBW7618011.1 dTDP-4-dehydrorhamnose 3,5-epimerase [Citrobacter portucalensis]MBW7637233.1 dTDP-4-dehydrorhamnose 3,5-epimerase [Citrobacter portucalensis]MCA2131318.1 dTDP-4-dehydrorhamnose 3,5-epimerase [Citrobacter portucalensis]MCA2141497.1 dTDP-4-dehydrorhamnose 3,5-epimerase [Citrobacter portucalensis]MCA2147080.1 dTDP-4-dehydrorhamnose 3,5-epimerase [Citrobacter portucalensis]